MTDFMDLHPWPGPDLCVPHFVFSIHSMSSILHRVELPLSKMFEYSFVPDFIIPSDLNWVLYVQTSDSFCQRVGEGKIFFLLENTKASFSWHLSRVEYEEYLNR